MTVEAQLAPDHPGPITVHPYENEMFDHSDLDIGPEQDVDSLPPMSVAPPASPKQKKKQKQKKKKQKRMTPPPTEERKQQFSYVLVINHIGSLHIQKRTLYRVYLTYIKLKPQKYNCPKHR